jgi:hypothetical protein
MKAKRICIYGIVPNYYSSEMFLSLEYSGFYAIPYKKVSAIVSDIEANHETCFGEETGKNIVIKHKKIIEELNQIGFNTLIPLRAGTIVRSLEDVTAIFANGYALITSIMKKMELLTEFHLTVTWTNYSSTLKEITKDSDVIELNENIMKNFDHLSISDQMEAALLVQSKIKEINEKVELSILETLSPLSQDLKLHYAKDEQIITKTAFLIGRDDQEKFGLVVDLLDEEYDGSLDFKLTGPFPCYSFYTIEVEKLSLKDVIEANNELGIKEDLSVTAIKDAYMKKANLFRPDVCKKNGDEEYFNRITKAYHVLLGYSTVANQIPKEEVITKRKRKTSENLLLVKLKD